MSTNEEVRTNSAKGAEGAAEPKETPKKKKYIQKTLLRLLICFPKELMIIY